MKKITGLLVSMALVLTFVTGAFAALQENPEARLVPAGTHIMETPAMLYERSCDKAQDYVNDKFAHSESLRELSIDRSARDENGNIVCKVNIVKESRVPTLVVDSRKSVNEDGEISVLHYGNFNWLHSVFTRTYTPVDLTSYVPRPLYVRNDIGLYVPVYNRPVDTIADFSIGDMT